MTTHEESPNELCQEHGGDVLHWVTCEVCQGIFCQPCYRSGHTCIILEAVDGTDDPAHPSNWTGPHEDEASEVKLVGTDLGVSYTPVLVKIAPMEAEMLLDVVQKIHDQVGMEMERARASD